MTKLEDKLLELGYKRVGFYQLLKRVNENALLIMLDNNRKEIIAHYVDYYARGVCYQWQLDNLQQAFNQLQKDLEVLREC